MKTFRGYPQFYTLSSLLNGIQRGESTPNTYLIQEQLFSNRCFLKLCKIHVKTSLLESLFNNVAALKAWNFIKERLRHRYLPVNFPLKNLIYKTSPDDCSCWFLRYNQSFIHWSHCLFFSSLFSFIFDNCNHGSLLRKCLKMKTFLLFTVVYSKVNINVVKTISP